VRTEFFSPASSSADEATGNVQKTRKTNATAQIDDSLIALPKPKRAQYSLALWQPSQASTHRSYQPIVFFNSRPQLHDTVLRSSFANNETS
jgi:hypothetical protein